MQIRRATSNDAAAIARVQERSWQAAYRHVFPVEELDRGGFVSTGRWRDRLARPPEGWTTLVAEAGGAVIGFAALGPSRDENGTGELYAIYVDPAHWSTGAGSALIERSESELSGEYVEATLWVLDDNPRARLFYERAGWAADGGRKSEERFGINAQEVRYRKRLTTSRSPS